MHTLFLSLFCCFTIQAKITEDLGSLYCQRWNWMSICDFSYSNDADAGVGNGVFRYNTPFNP